jgi:hypothetical protein
VLACSIYDPSICLEERCDTLMEDDVATDSKFSMNGRRTRLLGVPLLGLIFIPISRIKSNFHSHFFNFFHGQSKNHAFHTIK